MCNRWRDSIKYISSLRRPTHDRVSYLNSFQWTSIADSKYPALHLFSDVFVDGIDDCQIEMCWLLLQDSLYARVHDDSSMTLDYFDGTFRGW
jgi:hypothetical protein